MIKEGVWQTHKYGEFQERLKADLSKEEAKFKKWSEKNDARGSAENEAKYWKMKYKMLWTSDRIRISELYQKIRKLKGLPYE